MNIRNFVDALVDDDNITASKIFDTEISDKVATALDVKKRGIAQHWLNSVKFDGVEGDEPVAEIIESIDVIQKILDEGESSNIQFEDGTLQEVDTQTAAAIMLVYERLNDSNKKKIKVLLGKDKNSFSKVLDIVTKAVG